MKPLFQVAIYVNRKPSSLTNATHGGEPSEPLTENKAWKSGGELPEPSADFAHARTSRP